MEEILRRLVDIELCSREGKVLLSNQGQSIDGYTMLAEFEALAVKAAELLGIELPEVEVKRHIRS